MLNYSVAELRVFLYFAAKLRKKEQNFIFYYKFYYRFITFLFYFYINDNVIVLKSRIFLLIFHSFLLPLHTKQESVQYYSSLPLIIELSTQ